MMSTSSISVFITFIISILIDLYKKRATRLHHRKVAQKMGEGSVRPYIYYLIPCIFFHTANQVLKKGSLNASVG